MGSSQKIVSGVVWSTICNIVNAIYGFIAVPILINYFGKAEYGLIGLAMSVNVYMQLMDMGFNSTNVRFYSTWLAKGDYIRLNRGFQSSLSLYGIIGLINFFALVSVGLFCEKLFNVTIEQGNTLMHLFMILSVSAFCQWFSSCYDQLIKATENIAWIQKRTLFTKFLMILVLVITIVVELSIEWYFLLTCFAALAIVPLSVKKIRSNMDFISFMPKWDTASIKEMLPYCLNIFSFSLFQFSFYNLRPVFLGIQGTVESVADYRILNGIIGIVTLLGGAFVGILLPSTSKIVAQNDKNAYYRVAYDGTKYISIMISFCCFGMMSVGSEVLTMYVGKSYLYLIPWFNLWLLCTLSTHNQAISSLILAGNDIRAITYNSIVASILGLISAWVLIPHYDIGGVCIAFAIYAIIQITFYYLYYWPKKMGINSWKVFSECFFVYVLIGIAAYYITLQIHTFSSVFITFVIKGSSFILLFILLLCFAIKKEDRIFFVRLFLKK